MFTKKLTGEEWLDITQRLEKLEAKVFGKKKAPIALNQQILVLKHLGMLDKISELPTSNEKKYKFLAFLLKADESNTKKGMNALAKNDIDIVNIPNYRFLSKLFNEFDLDDYSLSANNKVRELEKINEDNINALNRAKFKPKK